MIVCSLGLNTFGLWLQYIVGVDPSPIGLWQFFTMEKGGIKKSFWTYLFVSRMPYLLLNLAANGILVGIIQQTKVLERLLLKVSADGKKEQNPA